MPPIGPPPVPGLEVQLDSYASKIKALGVLWFVYAGVWLLVSLAGIAFMKAIMFGTPPPYWLFPAILPFVWLFVALRTALALAAGWGLLHHAGWGRIVAIIAAILNLIKFPFGTALGIFTLVVLLGYQNTRLYEQI
jgi:hypothetical protein